MTLDVIYEDEQLIFVKQLILVIQQLVFQQFLQYIE